MTSLLTKLGVAGTTSLVVCEAVNLEPLYNALITLAVSVVSVLTIEGIQWLKQFIKSHTKKDENKQENDFK